jgi:glycosyltransferase involved in cell wall biosynthesis
MERSLLAVAPVSDLGGAETTLLRLLDGLGERGWQITLSTPGPGPLRDAGVDAGWTTVSLPVGGLRRRRGARAVGSWVRARRLAGAHGVVYLNGTVCGRLLPALRGAGARLVLHVDDLVSRVPGIWQGADVVLAASRAAADRLDGLDPHVVYPPVDPDPPAVSAPWPPGDGPLVGYVGLIEPRKGARDLVQAAPAIHAGAPAARIVLVGDDEHGVDRRYRDAVVADSETEHYGSVDGAAGLMRHLDVLVLPAHRERSGTVLAEAMAVGTPVVATRIDGLPEVVQDGVTGLLVEPGDPEALATAVLRVLERRGDMGAAAAQSARRFHTPRYVDAVERLITA